MLVCPNMGVRHGQVHVGIFFSVKIWNKILYYCITLKYIYPKKIKKTKNFFFWKKKKKKKKNEAPLSLFLVGHIEANKQFFSHGLI